MRAGTPIALLLAAMSAAAVYPNRWVFVSRSLQNDREVEEIRAIARTASEHGLNGLVLSSGLDRLDLQPDALFERVRQVKRICDEYGLELIPPGGFRRQSGEELPASGPARGDQLRRSGDLSFRRGLAAVRFGESE